MRMTTEQQQTAPAVFPVDPSRLAPGEWRHDLQKTIGRGDIYASYSAMQIGMNQPVRKPFAWKGGLWVCVSITSKGGDVSAEVYRLVHPQAFAGQATSYRDKTLDGGAARNGPNGFYHGMSVKHGGGVMVLCGPPASLVCGEAEQMDLFGKGETVR
jgi:hypothetical protein